MPLSFIFVAFLCYVSRNATNRRISRLRQRSENADSCLTIVHRGVRSTHNKTGTEHCCNAPFLSVRYRTKKHQKQKNVRRGSRNRRAKSSPETLGEAKQQNNITACRPRDRRHYHSHIHTSHLAFARRRYLSSLRMTMYIDSDSTQPGLRWLRPGDTPGRPACSWLLMRQKGNATWC